MSYTPQTIQQDLEKTLPNDLVDALLSSYQEIKANFFLGKHEPSELNGGKFVEACVRILQHETAGQYTPIGTQIKDMIGILRNFEQVPGASASETFRIHIPRVLLSIYNIRNKRGVGHLGGDVNPNHVDATLITACADWTLVELFRIYYRCTLQDAQKIADAAVQRNIPLVYELDTIKRVLLPQLSQRSQTLVLLSVLHPQLASEADLISWVEPKSSSTYRRLLRKLHSERLLEYVEEGGKRLCAITPLGLRYVEQHYEHWQDQLNR